MAELPEIAKLHLHPQKKISDMSGEETKLLYSTITEVLILLTIVSIKTGSTSTFICPACQKV